MLLPLAEGEFGNVNDERVVDNTVVDRDDDECSEIREMTADCRLRRL